MESARIRKGQIEQGKVAGEIRREEEMEGDKE